MRPLAFSVAIAFLIPNIAAVAATTDAFVERYKARDDAAPMNLEARFRAAFGDTSVGIWTDDGRRLRKYIGDSGDLAFESPDAVLLKLKPFLKVPLNDLKLKNVTSTPSGLHYEYEQMAGGVFLKNAILSFDLDLKGALRYVNNETAPFPLPATNVQISDAEACCHARCDLAGGPCECTADPPQLSPEATLLQCESAAKWLWVIEGRAIWSHVVVARDPRPATRQTRRYIIDGRIAEQHRGKIVDRRDSVFRANPQSQVFIPNPIVTGGAVAIDAIPDDTYRPCDLQHLVLAQSGDQLLSGDFVRIDDFERQSTPLSAVAAQQGHFNFRRGGHEFASAMIYCHVDRMHDYLVSLGFDKVVPYAIPADPAIGFSTPVYDAWYEEPDMQNPGVGRMAFGYQDQPRIFVAEDGDIIAHEYAHAIQSSQAPLKFASDGEAGAMREGFADYWTMTYFEGATGTPVSLFGEWMETARSNPLALRAVRQIPLDCTVSTCVNASNDVYKNGMLWTATLWEIHQRLRRDLANTIILRSHSSAAAAPTFKNQAEAIIAADGLITNHDNADLLVGIFRSREIFADAEGGAILAKIGVGARR